MRGVWALVAAVCGVVTAWSIGAIVPHVRWPPGVPALSGLACCLALLYATWRSALRIRRPSTAAPVEQPAATSGAGLSPRRLVASSALAFVVMFVSGPLGLYIADSGDWGGDGGILGWTLLLLGRGLSVAANALHLNRRLGAVIVLAQFVLLASLFYSVGTWWAGRRAGVLEPTRRRLSPDSRRRAGVILSAAGAVLALVTIWTAAMHLLHRGRDLATAYEGASGVEAFRIATYEGEVLWHIEAFPERVLERLRYGEVPEGFRQLVPESGRPRPFRKGEHLMSRLFVRGDRGAAHPKQEVQHYGQALDERRFESGISSFGPRHLLRGLSLDQMQREIERQSPLGTDMQSVRSVMKSEAFACQDIKDGRWDDRAHASFLVCRRMEAASESSVRTWEVALFSHRDGFLQECLIRESLRDLPAR